MNVEYSPWASVFELSNGDVWEDCASLRRQILAEENGSLKQSPVSSLHSTSILGAAEREEGGREGERKGQREGEREVGVGRLDGS